MAGPSPDIREARQLFPATRTTAYLNTAATGLASTVLAETYHRLVDEWTEAGFDFVRGEEAAERARRVVAGLVGADPADVALIASVSAAAGLVSASLPRAARGENVVIGEREYSSNHFPWRQLEHKGYEVRQVPFRRGGLEPDDVGDAVDGGTQVVAFSAVQSATGHRSDIGAISAAARAVGALVFVDGSQAVGALALTDDLAAIDVLATADHKFLLHAGRGMGYCYLSRAAQDRLVPVNAGWKAGREPFASFFGPTMDLSPSASRFDNSISWVAALGNEAALAVFEQYGAPAIYERNAQLAAALRTAVTERGWVPVDLPDANRSAIVAIPLGAAEPAAVLARLKDRGVVGAARDGHLRVTVHFYNHEDDIARLGDALPER